MKNELLYQGKKLSISFVVDYQQWMNVPNHNKKSDIQVSINQKQS